MNKLPSTHQLGDRVYLDIGADCGRLEALVVGVFFTDAKVLYTVLTAGGAQLENVDSFYVNPAYENVTKDEVES